MCPRPRIKPGSEAKLWILLVGVNQYQDKKNLPSLQYSALDCQGLGEALKEATASFAAKQVIIHHDFVTQRPNLGEVRSSIEQIIKAAQPEDTILFYFSGHGILETKTQQVVLCLADTKKEQLLDTGLALNDLLRQLSNCAASQQLVWLDACHSGGMTLRGTTKISLANPTSQLVEVLRHKASQSKGFYALLSCDQTQQSWEFPELGHGVFTYYLMRGLRGEAADSQGVIEADALYQYVYHQTLRYIDKTNQQIRLINQQKSSRGERRLESEFPLQTPKRIVEGFGKVILGKRSLANVEINPRQALIVDGGFLANRTTFALSQLLQASGRFSLKYFPQTNEKWSEVRNAIAICLNSQPQDKIETEVNTAFLYLRGNIETSDTGESWLVLKDEVRLSRSWLRKVLRSSRAVQQIVILDCPGNHDLTEWIEDLRLETERGQCLIAASAPAETPQQFTNALLETLQNVDAQAGLPIAAWITQLQIALAGTKIVPQLWLSGTRGVIEVLPGKDDVNRDHGEIFDLGICPYMGLQAFNEDHAEYFYGRKALVQKLLNQVNHKLSIAVVGASGSGKSSAVQAGLMAQLRQGKQIPGSDRWWLGCFRPGSKPIQALAKLLTDSGTKEAQAQEQLQIEGLLYQGVEGFVQWLRTRPEPMVLLAIDQFEELFTLAGVTESQLLIELILGAIKYAGDRLKLVLIIRADFVASCLEIPELAQILQQGSVLVPPYLTEASYRKAIIKPAQQVGLKVEPGLVEVLLQDLDRSAGDLPLLQFVLQQLWERRKSGELTLKAYQKLGGIKGALERQAQSVYDSLDAESQDCARWIFLNLTQLGEGTEDTRRRITKSDLVVEKYPAALVEKTLHTLTAAKLLVINLDQGISDGQSRGANTPDADDELFLEAMQQEVTVEVVHEILIRHWSSLRWWLEENRSRLRAQRQIEQAAILWQQKDKQPDFLLRGVRLAEAEEIFIKYTDELTEAAKEFVATCIDARLEEQREAKRRLRKAQLTAAALGILGLVATGFGITAYQQKLITQLENVDALNASSEALLLSNQQLESLVTGVKAGKQLTQIGEIGQRLVGQTNWQDAQVKTAATLQQAIYGTQELNRLEGHSQKVNAVAYSPDGQLIATASDDHTIKIWNKDGLLINTLKGHKDRVTKISFNSTGTLLASASADQSVILWQINNNKITQIKKLIGHTDWVTDVALSDGQSPRGTHRNNLIATASRDGTIKLWQQDGTLIDTLSGHQDWVNTISFSPNSELLASGGEDSTVRLWQINREGGKEVKIIQDHQDIITDVSFSSDGKYLATAAGNGMVKLWQTSNSNLIKSYPHQTQINSLSFSPDGKLLAVATIDGKVNIWNRDGTLQQTLTGHNGEVLDTKFAPNLINNQRYELASTSVDKTIRLWQVVSSHSSEQGAIYSVAVSPTSPDIFAAAGWDNKITIWRKNPDGTQKLIRTLPGHQETIAQIQFSPDGKLIASASWDKTIKLWSAENGSLINTLKSHQDGVTSLAFSQETNGYLLVSGSEDKTVKLWQITNNKTELLKTFTGHTDSVKTVAIDGNLIASGGYDQTIKLWNLKGELLQTLTGHNLAITSLQFSPDDHTLASASWDNTIKLWQIKNSGKEIKELNTFTGHQDGVTSLSFNADGTVLASGSGDRNIKLWNTTEKTLIKTLQGHPSQINSLAFSNDNKTIISADEQQGLFWWNLELDNLLNKGCSSLSDYLQSNPNVTQGDRTLGNYTPSR